MSLDLKRLEKVRELAGGIVQARCPACAEGGGDRAGVHLRVFADGRFGCCVNPKDREHRKRIFALAGDKTPRSFAVRLAVGGSEPAAPKSVKSALADFRGTLGTAKTESVSSGKMASQASQDSEGEVVYAQSKYFGTLGTPLSMSRAYAREEEHVMCSTTHTYKDLENGVPSVPEVSAPGRLPYLTPDGVLGIPFDSPERFHWWKGGQGIAETRAEVESWMSESARKEQDGIGI